ncbi:biofilm operon icaADBC HTH-type negative transcriptional regulator IcaR [Peptococcaceae bacterium CEB3]|nr:biofilm operon icaADBC HTH-type negative transcriptional regulator IcaR [Peptococcaceae bacterium CEB3]
MGDADDKGDKSYPAKQKIMDAAREIFAEKGFDGARVDEIAKRAQVNKALIYYYFESKEQILEELMEWLVHETVDFKKNLFRNEGLDYPGDLNIALTSMGGKLEIVLNRFLAFFKDKRDILNIVTTEALKEGPEKNYLFRMIQMMLEDSSKRMIETYDVPIDVDALTISTAFFALIPMITFITFGQKWAEYNHKDYSSTEKKFAQVLNQVYYEYFLGEILKMR